MEKSKVTIVQTLICVGLLCVIWGAFFLVEHRIVLSKNQMIEPREDNFSWVYQVDTIDVEKKEMMIQGFAFQIKKDAIGGTYEFVLHDLESGKNYFPKSMEYKERNDVNEYFFCENNYLESGFAATYKLRKDDIEEKDFQIYLRVVGEKTAYQTEIFISKGELVYANPKNFEPLNLIGTDLEEVVEDGILRVYCPEAGMYVYQYNEALYWIAEDDYDFDEKGNTYVQYQLDTTQIEKLPEERLRNEWYWDNISFYFLENELTDFNVGKYRVTKKALPKEYSITKILTGNVVDGSWVWQRQFRPFYVFK